MNHRAFITIFFGFILLLSSCSIGRMSAKWKENSIDGPWVGPGVHAREFEREYFAGIMDSVVTTDTVWTSANGSRRNAGRIATSVEEYLKKLGYFDKWPESQSTSDGYTQRLAPFTFHIVALDPCVVIMVPHDFGNPKGNRSINDIMRSAPGGFGSRYMLNPIGYGTTLPYHPDLLWFSPDLGVPPTALAQHGDSDKELVHKRIKLALKREQDAWATRRE